MDNNELIEKVLQLEREAEERKRLDEKLQIASRLDDIERMTANLDGKDMTPDAPRAGVFAELQGIMPRRDEIKSSLLPFQIEFGKPTADVTADGYSVTLQPCDVDGNSYASADTIIVFVPCHGESIELGLYGWIAAVAEIPEDPGPPIVPAVPAVPGTVLSFIRFAPWFNAPHVEGVLIGIGGPTTPSVHFSARLVQEDASGLGEYDQWKEVIPAADGIWVDRDDGDERTHDATTPNESLWESNDTEGIHAHATTGVVVSVRLEGGQYSFEYERMRGDNETAGTKTAGVDDATWIQIETDGTIVRGRHCYPGPGCSDWNICYPSRVELDEVGHVRKMVTVCGVCVGPCA